MATALGPLTSSAITADLVATPFRGRPRPHAADRIAYRSTTRWRGYERAVRDEAAAHHVEVLRRRPAEGLWLGTAEPAESIQVRGQPEHIEQMARALARRYNQDAVMVITPDPAGPGMVYRFPGRVNADRALELLRLAGVPGGRVSGGHLEIADTDDSLSRQISVLTRMLGRPVAARASIALVDKGRIA